MASSTRSSVAHVLRAKYGYLYGNYAYSHEMDIFQRDVLTRDADSVSFDNVIYIYLCVIAENIGWRS